MNKEILDILEILIHQALIDHPASHNLTHAYNLLKEVKKQSK